MNFWWRRREGRKIGASGKREQRVKRYALHLMAGTDTKVRPGMDSLTLTLSQRERGFGGIRNDQIEQRLAGYLEKKYAPTEEPKRFR